MKTRTYPEKRCSREGRIGKIVLTVLLTSVAAFSATGGGGSNTFFSPGNLVVAVEGCGVYGGTCTSILYGAGTNGGYGDNQAAPLTLFQYTPSGTASVAYVNSLVFPQTPAGADFAVSGEYGSSSEATLQLSNLGDYLTIMGYGINAATFDTAYPPGFMTDAYGAAPSGALAQSGSLTTGSYTPIPRVVALIDVNGNVNSSTGLYNIFDTNNPRSAYTLDGFNVYVSGQGNTQGTGNVPDPDNTGGVFYVPLFSTSTTPTAITGQDTENKNGAGVGAQDARNVQIFNNTLYVSVDSKEGTGDNRDFIATLGSPPATSQFGSPTSGVYPGPTQIPGFGNNGGTGKLTITAANTNGINSVGTEVNLSPVSYFFANATTLYVTDGGQPKNDSVTNDTGTPTPSAFGNGGLQKWTFSSGKWSLKYTLGKQNGLPLVANTNADGTSGLYGLAAQVSGGNVLLYVTDYTISDLDTTSLWGFTDVLSATTNPGTLFTKLDTAPGDSKFKGVSFAPTAPSGGVEITASPSGLTFTTSGAGCASGTYIAPQMLVWTPGSTCTLSVSPAPQSPPTGPLAPLGTPTGVQYVFSQWDNGLTSTTRTVTGPATLTTYTANFTTDYLLTTTAGTGGSVSAGGYYASGANATITATPNIGYYFVNFTDATGAVVSTGNPLSLPMNEPQTITATFAPQITPTITWAAPAAITFGGALGSGQLNAAASVPGTFVYTPAAGTVLPVGNGQTLSVAFTPSDTTHYTTATAPTTINVNPAAPPASPANLVITKVLTRSGGNVVVQLTIANTGGTAAANVVLGSVKVGADTATPLPQNIGAIAAGGSATAAASVPGSVGASGAASSLVLSGSFTGGTFSSSARITLP
jgi:hypothetical protein